VILSFMDLRIEGDHPLGLYAQRFDRNGNRMWGDEALPVALGRYTESGLEPSVVSDGQGGAYLGYWAYVEDRPIAVQHVTHEGEVEFEIDHPHGAPCSYGGVFPRRNGNGALTWGYLENEEDSLSCTKMNEIGEVDWAVQVINPFSTITHRDNGSIVDTENHGLWIAYGTYHQPHVARLNPDGSLAVPAMNMFPDYSETNPYYSHVICDDDGNAYMRVSSNDGHSGLRVNKATPDGSLPWGGEGIHICNEDSLDSIGRTTELLWDNERQSILVGFKSVFVINDSTWWKSIYIQSLFPDGSREWGDEGSLVMKTDMALLLARGFVIKLSDGSYSVIVTGVLNGSRYLLAGKVYSDGTAAGTSGITEPEPVMPAKDWRILSTYPNPFNSQVVFDLQPGTGEAVLTIYDLTGREFFRSQLNNHTNRFTWIPGNQLASGIYYSTVRTADQVDTRKIVLLK